MQFQARFRDPIRRGEIKCTVRIWQRPHVRAGGRYRLGTGAIVVDRIDEIGLEGLTPEVARRCGFASLVELLKVAKHGPWTRETLRLIAANPGVRAADLAASVQRERLDFKADVRKLKALGLTISLEVGYRLSPRGEALLKARA